jgi:hypothetical protein
MGEHPMEGGNHGAGRKVSSVKSITFMQLHLKFNLHRENGIKPIGNAKTPN